MVDSTILHGFVQNIIFCQLHFPDKNILITVCVKKNNDVN